MSEGTRPFDPMQLVLVRLTEIAQDIREFPSLLARLEALTESTRQLEVALRETTRELRSRDEEQQRALTDMSIKQSGFANALNALHLEFERLQEEQEKCPTRLECPRKVQQLERQVEAVLDIQSKQNMRIRKLEDDGGDVIVEWLPWLKGIKWTLLIVLGVFVTALAVALLWAVVQSGAGLP